MVPKVLYQTKVNSIFGQTQNILGLVEGQGKRWRFLQIFVAFSENLNFEIILFKTLFLLVKADLAALFGGGDGFGDGDEEEEEEIETGTNLEKNMRKMKALGKTTALMSLGFGPKKKTRAELKAESEMAQKIALDLASGGYHDKKKNG